MAAQQQVPTLEQLKKEIETATAEQNQLTGKVETLMGQLKALGLNSLDEANTSLLELQKEIPILTNHRDDGLVALRAKYEF